MEKSEWTLWPDENMLVKGDYFIGLTPKEAVILDGIVRKKGHPARWEYLIDFVYGQRDEPDDPHNVIDSIVCKLKKKLAGTDFTIASTFAVGLRTTKEVPVARFNDEEEVCLHCGRPFDRRPEYPRRVA